MRGGYGRRWITRYFVEIGAALVPYALAIVFLRSQLPRIEDPALRIAVALLPMPPALFVLIAVIRYVRRVDELWRAKALEAIALSAGITGFIALGYGFLEFAGLPPISVLYVAPFMCLVMAIQAAVASAGHAWRATRARR